MNRRQKIIVSITGIFIVMLALVGLTYAYFLTRITGNENEKSISVTTANLELIYEDGNGFLKIEKIEPSNEFIQFKDSEGATHSSKKFTVTNNGNALVEGYEVYFENVRNSFERKDDLVYTLSCKAYTNYGETNQALSGTCNEVGSETTFPSVVTSIVSNDINVGITHEYELKLKYKEMNVDQSIDMNKALEAKINIYNSETMFLASEIMEDAFAGTNGTTYVEPSKLGIVSNSSIPAQEASKLNESIMSYTFDDYGTSYYFRGKVQNNFVTFDSGTENGNMCWRIIRVEGDGSVKLILDYDKLACNQYGSVSWVTDQNTFTIGNFGYDSETYQGKTIMDYLNPKGDSIPGAMSTQLKNFQSTLNGYGITNLLKAGDWCLSDTAYATKKVDFNNDKPIDKLTYYNAQNQVDGSEYYNFYYDGLARLAIDGNDIKSPSLKCTGTLMDKFNDGTDMYVGAITADEVAFAGSKYVATSDTGTAANNDNYLAMGVKFWTLTPRRYEADGATNVMIVWDSGRLHAMNVNGSGAYPRPVISLQSETEILKGNGTRYNPYVIKLK